MNRNQIIGTTSLKALATVIVLGAVARAGLPYLPLTGPPPLRLLAAKNLPAPAVIPLSASHPSPPTNPPAADSQALAPVVAYSAFAGTTNSTSSETLVGGSENPLSDPRTAAIFAMPTPDLLSITPQMLATYFHPVAFNTNVFVGPYPVGFTPPLPPVGKSSHAEYLVK